MIPAHPEMSRSRLIGAYLGDIRFELVKMIRTPAFAIPTLLFPILFFMLFGVLMGSMRGQGAQALFAFASYGVFGAIAPGLFGFGVSLAFEREQGLLTYRQAIPMPAGSYLLARMIMAMIFVGIASLAMIMLAIFVAHVPLTMTQGVTVFFLDVFGVLPFCAMGLFVGALVSGSAAPAIVNLIYIPMSFLSGLWVPMQYLPKIVQQLAPIWPAHHLVQLTLSAVSAPGTVGSTENHVGALLGATILFFGLALRRLSGRGITLFRSAAGSRGIPLRRAINVGVFGIAVALVIVGVIGGSAPHANASPAATSTDATHEEGGSAATDTGSSAAPVGVAAPSTTLIADFDNGSDQASYGVGWTAFDDKTRGGDSTTSQRLVAKGAEHSKGALEVSGNVGTAIQYAFVGTSFLPNGKATPDFSQQGFMDYSSRHTLRFFARGDGSQYTVAIMGPAVDTMPAMYGFVAGPDWQEVVVPLAELSNIDLKLVKAISVGTMTPGPFRFQIDNVRVE